MSDLAISTVEIALEFFSIPKIVLSLCNYIIVWIFFPTSFVFQEIASNENRAEPIKLLCILLHCGSWKPCISNSDRRSKEEKGEEKKDLIAMFICRSSMLWN
ncbi:uncharacterized protein PHA67_007735 isoform 1-T1 [Liasis olivaceus]